MIWFHGAFLAGLGKLICYFMREQNWALLLSPTPQRLAMRLCYFRLTAKDWLFLCAAIAPKPKEDVCCYRLPPLISCLCRYRIIPHLTLTFQPNLELNIQRRLFLKTFLTTFVPDHLVDGFRAESSLSRSLFIK